MRTCDAQGRLLLSWNARPMENRLEVRGTGGRIEIDRFLQVCRLHRNFPGPKFVGVALNAMLNAAMDLVGIPWNILRFLTGSLAPSPGIRRGRSEEHTSELQSLMRTSYAVFCLQNKNNTQKHKL